MSGSTGEQPAVTPTVSTAPARSRWSKLPAHLGRARTSTVVLGVLFLAIGTLWLNIRPETPDAGTTTSGVSDQQPAPTTTPAAPTTAEETTTPAPETTDDEPTTTEESTTSEPTSGTTDSPTPTDPTETDAPTTTLPNPGTPTDTPAG
ncbi:hypothetical protein E4P40_18145 [Blastococcus sp. CT_GayMR20]|uniref:hypothetical protein n=1 Tax=Blastococcus sp. CT_GayMR20 TaxID=2559609 RepID=UPI0010748425|nr:hypothetical protein [Blastococcus sp. CT_GayMR20]TFV80125.1 hypothetical protein E4P40_18145 [Blastococcus sp. CT_GayMR20]